MENLEKILKKGKKILSTIENYYVLLFLIAFFLIKIPPFYLFFPIRSAYLTSHTLSRLIVSFIFGAIFLNILVKKNKKEEYKKMDKTLLYIFLGYLFFHSLSLVAAVNVTEFLRSYKDVIFPGLFLIAALYVKKERVKFAWVIVITAAINFFYQMFMFWAPGLFLSIGSKLIYDAHYNLVSLDLHRQRIFIESADEIAIPFLFILFAKEKVWKRRFLIVAFLMMISIPSFLSNFRSRALMLGVSFFLTALFMFRKKISEILIPVSVLFLSGVASFYVVNSIYHFSLIDRFTFQSRNDDVITAISRIEDVERSFHLALSHPLTGVGLGNYFENLPLADKNIQSIFPWVAEESRIAAGSPHNIFALEAEEAGIANLIFFTAFVGYFLYIDYKKIIAKKKDRLSIAYSISFWSLFAYGFVNPATTLPFNALFWVLRAFI